MLSEAMANSESLRYWAYRVMDWVALHLLDDPAWLALMFC
jgi:hypothetical protein